MNKLLIFLSGFLLFIGGSIWVIVGLWGFWIELGIVNEIAGFWGIVIAFTILPATLFATPFYALIANGNWFPLALIYGGGLVGAILYGFGVTIREHLEKEKWKEEYALSENITLPEGEEK